jgi:hypothetical protein
MFFDLPDPDLLIILNRSGSGSFHHKAKRVRKTLISILLFCDLFMIFVIIEEIIFCWHLEGHCRKEQDLEQDLDPDPDPDP